MMLPTMYRMLPLRDNVFIALTGWTRWGVKTASGYQGCEHEHEYRIGHSGYTDRAMKTERIL